MFEFRLEVHFVAVQVENRRTLTFMGHNGSGKSTIIEAMLKLAGKISEIGTTLNYDPLEKEKNTTLSVGFGTFEKDGYEFITMDTPGFGDFLSEVISALFAAENAVSVINAASGIEVQTERTWKQAEALNKPIMIFINQMDKERADYNKILDDLKAKFDKNIVPVYLPIGKEDNFKGIVDLLNNCAYVYSADGSGKKEKAEIPEDLLEQVEELRMALVEDIVETDDDLMEKYLGGEEIDGPTLAKAMKSAYALGELVPVCCGSATKNIGIDLFLDLIKATGANPTQRNNVETKMAEGEKEFELPLEKDAPFVGYIFKAAVDPFIGKQSFVKVFSGEITNGNAIVNVNKDSNEKASHIYHVTGKEQEEIEVANLGDIVSIPKLKESEVGDTLCNASRKLMVVKPEYPEPMLTKSVHPKSKGDIDKISNGLSKLSESDPTFTWEHDAETNDTVISGMGTSHLNVMIDRLKKLFKVDVEVGQPKIPYKETVKGNSDVEYKHKKQSGGHGQYGHVKIKVSPRERGKGFEFAQSIFGGSVPNNYIPSVEKGVVEAMKKGILASYPVVDIKVELYDGSYHDVDSSDMAFQIAARQAFKKGMQDAKPILLEPVMDVEVHTPEENSGDVMGEITSRRGRPMGMEAGSKGYQVVKATVPYAEMLDFSNQLSSITSGKGFFTMQFAHYAEVPSNEQDKIIAARKRELEEQE